MPFMEICELHFLKSHIMQSLHVVIKRTHIEIIIVHFISFLSLVKY